MKRVFLYTVIINLVSSEYNCTDLIDDTCYIDTIAQWDNRKDYIWCSQDPSYPNCELNCNGDQYCGDDNTDLNPQVVCPYNGDTCIINCNNNKACAGLSVNSNNCSYVELNVAGTDGKRMNIYAPGNGGTLLIQLTTSFSVLKETKVYAQSDTKNITILCNGGGTCFQNEFHAETMMEHGNGVFNFECDVNGGIGSCDTQQIYCPTNQIGNTINDTNCNIKCEGDCSAMNVYAIEGEHDVTWACDNDNINACITSKLKCGATYGTTASYAHSGSEWTLASNCDGTPTDDPTPSPTYDPTNEPTLEPTLDPSAEPSENPTRFPSNEPTYKPTMEPTIMPTIDPTNIPSNKPSEPSMEPTQIPTNEPTNDPTNEPSNEPTNKPTISPTSKPTEFLAVPTIVPTFDFNDLSSSTPSDDSSSNDGKNKNKNGKSSAANDGQFIEMAEWQWTTLLLVAMFIVFCVVCLCVATAFACYFHFKNVHAMEKHLALKSLSSFHYNLQSSNGVAGETINTVNTPKTRHKNTNDLGDSNAMDGINGENDDDDSYGDLPRSELEFSHFSDTVTNTKQSAMFSLSIASANDNVNNMNINNNKLAHVPNQMALSNADSRLGVTILSQSSPTGTGSDLSNFF